jgi:hypothetical protein
MRSPALIPFAGPADLAMLSPKLPAMFLVDARASECF